MATSGVVVTLQLLDEFNVHKVKGRPELPLPRGFEPLTKIYESFYTFLRSVQNLRGKGKVWLMSNWMEHFLRSFIVSNLQWPSHHQGHQSNEKSFITDKSY